MLLWLDWFLTTPTFAWGLIAFLIVWVVALVRRLHLVQHDLNEIDATRIYWEELAHTYMYQRDAEKARVDKLFTIPTQTAERNGEALYRVWLN